MVGVKSIPLSSVIGLSPGDRVPHSLVLGLLNSQFSSCLCLGVGMPCGKPPKLPRLPKLPNLPLSLMDICTYPFWMIFPQGDMWIESPTMICGGKNIRRMDFHPR
jgi:hypothetical protein